MLVLNISLWKDNISFYQGGAVRDPKFSGELNLLQLHLNTSCTYCYSWAFARAGLLSVDKYNWAYDKSK